MGNFYTNVTVRGPRREEVMEFLRAKKREAYVSPTAGVFTTVYDADCDLQDEKKLRALAEDLSRELGCAALAVLNHDDDILMYILYEDGTLRDEYNSTPGYFSDSEEECGARGGNAVELCRAMGAAENAREVERILCKSGLEDDEFLFAVDRHGALARALGLPEFSIGLGYYYIQQGGLPEDLNADDFVHMG